MIVAPASMASPLRPGVVCFVVGCTGARDTIDAKRVRYSCGHNQTRREYDERIEAALSGTPAKQARGSSPPRLRLTQLSTVQARGVEYLPGGYIPASMFSLLAGDPGEGKTRILLELAAAVTRGNAWPEGEERCEPANVLFCGEEDTLEHVIRPVFDTLGGDAERFYAIEALVKEGRDGEDRESMFTLTDDGIEALEAAIVERRPRLMVVDPVTGHLGNRDSFKDAEVRGALLPLAKLAERYGVSIVGNAHLNKASQQAVAYRIGGSIAFRAVARAVFYVVPDPQDPARQRRLLFHDKSNVGAKREPRGYTIIDKGGVGVVAWDREPVTVTLADAFGAGVGGSTDERREQTEAERFLSELLAEGPLTAEEIDKARTAAGIAERTLKRAKGRLNVLSTREGFGPGAIWRWSLPASHSVPIDLSSDSMAPYGTQWHGMKNGAHTNGSIEGHRGPLSAIENEERGPRPSMEAPAVEKCSACDRLSVRRWQDGTPLCEQHYPKVGAR
ncbi:MAG: AAA family ATPase [Chloroflexota bacterium]